MLAVDPIALFVTATEVQLGADASTDRRARDSKRLLTLRPESAADELVPHPIIEGFHEAVLHRGD